MTDVAISPLAGELRRGLGRSVALGVAVILLFFGILGGWAAFAPLSSAAIARGVVSPDSSRLTVQHLEGGIIKEILVRDGSRVEAGQTLLVLEDIQARARREQLSAGRAMLAAREARLIAEEGGLEAIAFPGWLVADRASPATAETLDAQQALFESRAARRRTRGDIAAQTAARLEEQVRGFEEQVASRADEIALLDEEIAGVSQLLEQGLERRPRLLDLQRQRTGIETAIASLQTEIASARQQILEVGRQRIAEDAEFHDEVTAELADLQKERADIEEELAVVGNMLERGRITAPVAGTVVDLRFTSPQGVIQPAAPILDIVPRDDDAVIDARVSPMDIDTVHAGLTARVILPAYTQRNLPRLTGVVRQVSADRLQDERTGESYFLAKIEIDRSELETAGEDGRIELIVGMPVEVMIETGERTMLDYLLDPLAQTLRHAMRES